MSDLATARVVVNGKPHPVPEGMTIRGMLEHLGIAALGIAVAVNGRVVRASAHAETALESGDVVEIVRATSGG